MELKCGEAINAVGKTLFGGISGTIDALKNDTKKGSYGNFGSALKEGFGAEKGDWTAIPMGEGDNAWNLSGKKVVGGLAGLGLGYRFLSGGGVYRDKNGNTDIAGIPFV